MERRVLAYWTPEDGSHVEPGAFALRAGLSRGELGEPIEIEVVERP